MPLLSLQAYTKGVSPVESKIRIAPTSIHLTKKVALILLFFATFSQKTNAVESVATKKVIVFLSTRCPCSMSHVPKLKKLAEHFQKKGFQFQGVHSNADEFVGGESQIFFKSLDLPFLVHEDTDQKLLSHYKALKTPHVFVEVNGKIVYSGGVDSASIAENADDEYLEPVLNALSNGKEVPFSEKRALGCVIKRI